MPEYLPEPSGLEPGSKAERGNRQPDPGNGNLHSGHAAGKAAGTQGTEADAGTLSGQPAGGEPADLPAAVSVCGYGGGAKVHEDVIKNVISFAKGEGFGIAGLDFSPIKGPEGNIEYLLHLTKGDDDAVSEAYVDELVSRSHGDLDKKPTAE